MARAVPRVSASDSVKGVKKVAEKAKKKSRKTRLSGENSPSARGGECFPDFPLFPRTFYRESRGKPDIFRDQLTENAAERFLHPRERVAAVVVTALYYSRL
jgi:hypothetical protein